MAERCIVPSKFSNATPKHDHMVTYINLLPIQFKDPGIPFVRLGYSQKEAGSDSFSHGGMHFAPPGTAHPENGGTSMPLDPIDIPDEMLPYLTQQLAGLLRQHGKVEVQGDVLDFTPTRPGVACRLSLLLGCRPGSNKDFRYAIQVSARDAAEDDYFKVWNAIGILENQYLLPGGDAQIGQFETISSQPLNPRRLIFSIDGTQHDTDAEYGLLNYGPYSKEKSRRRTLHIAYLEQPDHSGDISTFLRNLQAGIQHPQRAASIWGRTWPEIFHFADVVFTPIHPSQFEHIEGLDFFLRGKKAGGAAVDVVVYFAAAMDARLEVDLLTLGISPHRIPISALELQDVPRAKCLLDNALALYAKCQGEPWLLTQDPQLRHEVVVGIGSHTIDGRELGYATVFTSQGNYRLGEAGWMPPGVTWEDYFGMLLCEKLLTVERENQWERFATVHLLLHLDRAMPAAQLAALKAHLQHNFGDRANIQVSFLHLHVDHAYACWAVGIDTAVKRGTCVQVSTHSALIQLAEASKPLLLELLEPSDNSDLMFKLRQVYYFSQMAWTSVRPAALPATLLYSQLVAAKFAAYSQVRPGLRLPDSLHTLPWYL